MEFYVSLTFLSAFLLFMLAFQIRRMDTHREFSYFLLVMLAAALWALFSGLRLLLPPPWETFMLKASFLGIISLPVFLFLFALNYRDGKWKGKKAISRLLWAVPLVSAMLMLTNAHHGLFWSEIIPGEVFAGVESVTYIPGPWFWVHSVYSYGLILLAMGWIFQVFRSRGVRLGQYAILLGILVPFSTSMLFVSGVLSFDFSPLVLSFTAMAFGWAISNGFYMRNIHELEAMQEKTSAMNRFYEVVVRLSEKLIHAGTDQMDEAIHEVLSELGAFNRVDRAYIFEYDEAGDAVSNTYEWCREGISPTKDKLQGISFSFIPRWKDHFFQNRHVYIPSVKDIPDEPLYEAEKEILEPQGIKSLIVVPMYHGPRFVGFAGFDSVRTHRAWDEQAILLLKLTANIIAGGIVRLRYERALIDQKQKAEAANRAKTEFLANMSHELRTPLNAIIGFTGIVHEEIADESLRANLQLVLDSSKSLLRLINDLLDFAKAEAGAMKIEPTKTELNQLLVFVKETFMPRVTDKGISLYLEVTERAKGSFWLDEIRLRQVLFNIVGNAVKFTSEGYVGIVADVLPEKQPQDVVQDSGGPYYTLLIQVKDTGIGIAEKDQEAIFHSFTQLSSGASRKYEGTGLGLNISHRLISLMGGKIELRSSEGRGSIFTIRITGVRSGSPW